MLVYVLPILLKLMVFTEANQYSELISSSDLKIPQERHQSIVQTFPVEPKIGQVRFQANLMQKVNETFLSFCGGSLIHSRWILTAAHCLEHNGTPYAAQLVYVTLGSIFTNGRGGQRIQADRLVLNKLYFDSDGGYDIGLVRLKKNAVIGKYVKPIKLHTNSRETLIGKKAYLTGFGIIDDFHLQPTRLRKAVLHIDTPNKCFLDPKSGYPEICCTSNLKEGKACKGDSGGPLTINVNHTYVQVGITSRLSFLPICSIIINNSIYTRVSSYINWISKATGIDFMKYVPPS